MPEQGLTKEGPDSELKKILDVLPLAVIISVGQEEKVEYLNPKFSQLFGYTLKDIPDVAAWWPLAYADAQYRRRLQQEWTARVSRAVEDRTAIEPMVTEVTCKDGSRKSIEFRFACLGEKNIVFGYDLTEREKAQETAQDSQKLLQRIIDLLPIRIFWKDKSLRFLGCNASFAKDAGKDKPDDLIGKDDFQMGWREQAEIYRADDKKVIESGKAKLNFEEPQTTPQGDTIWLKTSKVPLIDTEGHEIGVLGMYEDITDRKKMEAQLKEKNRQIEFILGATHTGLDIIDSDFNIIYIDPEWQKVYGDYKGRKCYEYFSGNTAMCPGCGIPKALETKKPVVSEEQLPREGNRRIQVISLPFQNESGEWLVAEVNVDITENKKMEEEMQKRLKELEVFYKASVGREERILALKKEIEQLKRKPEK